MKVEQVCASIFSSSTRIGRLESLAFSSMITSLYVAYKNDTVQFIYKG